MSGGDYNHGFLSVTVGDIGVQELVDVNIPPEAEGAAVEAILAGGGRAIGRRFTTMANTMTPTFSVQYPSSDEVDLTALAVLRTPVQFIFSYEDDTQLPDGALVGFSSANCILMKSAGGDFTEAPAVMEYSAHCIGYTLHYKGGRTITVDAKGNTTVN